MTHLDQNTSNSRSARPTFSCSSLKSPEAISDLIHKFGHDIGNPLTAVISMSSVLTRVVEGGLDLENKFVQKIPSYTESISKEAWRICLLNERMVMLFSNREQLSQPSDIEIEISKGITKLKQHGFCPEDLVIKTSYSEDKLSAHIDPTQFFAVASELLRNAIHATLEFNEGSTTNGFVTIRAKSLEDSVQIKVSNPIKESQADDLSELFEAFKYGNKAKKDCSGLGLTVVWSIVERFGGQVEVSEEMTDAQNGKFSVTIELPKGDAQSSESKKLSEPSELPEKIKVLVLEDEPIVASAIEKILHACFGKQCQIEVELYSGSEVFEKIDSNCDYDAILCDVKLADIGAKDVLEKLRGGTTKAS